MVFPGRESGQVPRLIQGEWVAEATDFDFFTTVAQFTKKLPTCLPSVRHGTFPCPAPVTITLKEWFDAHSANFIGSELTVDVNVSP